MYNPQYAKLLRECDIMERLYNEEKSALNANNMLLVCINRAVICIDSRKSYTEAIKILNQGIDIGERLHSNDELMIESELAKAYMNRGVAYEYLKKHKEALADKDKSVEMLEELRNNNELEDENLLALAFMNRGTTYESMGKYTMAIADGEKSISIWDRMKQEGGKIPSEYAKVLSNISIAKTKIRTSKNNHFGSQNKRIGSEMDEINKGIKMAKNMGDKFGLAVMYTMRGLSCFQLDEYKKAISDFDDAIEIMEGFCKNGSHFDENELAKAYAGRGMAYHPLREPVKAMKNIDKCSEIWERLQRENQYIDENFLLQVYSIRSAIINTTSENMDEAILGSQKSIKIAQRRNAAGENIDLSVLAMNYMIMGVSCDQKGVDCEEKRDIYGQKKAFEEANENYSKCIEIWEELCASGGEVDYDSLARAYMNRGSNYYHEMGEIEKALSDHNEAVRIREQLQKEGKQQDAFDLFMVYKNRSQAYEAGGNIKAAIKDIVPAMQVLKGSFTSVLEFQPIYYDVLEELIELVEKMGNKALLQKVFQEFLHPMRQVPKIPEAEMAQNNILRNLR